MKNNRLVSLLLALTLCCTALVLPTSAAQPGEPMGWVLYTDIVAYIDGHPIRSYNIAGNTYVIVEDLMDYGFSVTWDPSGPRLVIGDRTGVVSSTYTPAENTGTPGAPAMPYLYTDITTWIHGTQITGYNIGGYTVICMDDLARFYADDYIWDPANLALRMTVKSTTKEPELPPTPVQRELSAEEIYDACASSVFYLEVYDAQGALLSSGSGFFLSENGLAVTNCHVLMGGSKAKIQVSDTGRWYNVASILDYDIADDWAVFRVNGTGFSPLTIGDPSTVKGGAAVYAIGSPLGLQNSITAGIISNPARTEGGVTYIQTSAAISSGSSGGALINKFGEVIGITTAGYEYGENINLALPISIIDGYSTTSPISLAELWMHSRTEAYRMLEERLVPLYSPGAHSLILSIDNTTEVRFFLMEENGQPCLKLYLISYQYPLTVETELLSYIYVDQMKVSMKVYEDTYYSQLYHLHCSSVVENGCFCDFRFDSFYATSPEYYQQQDTMAAAMLLQLVGCVEMLREAIDIGDGSAEQILISLGFWELMM